MHGETEDNDSKISPQKGWKSHKTDSLINMDEDNNFLIPTSNRFLSLECETELTLKEGQETGNIKSATKIQRRYGKRRSKKTKEFLNILKEEMPFHGIDEYEYSPFSLCKITCTSDNHDSKKNGCLTLRQFLKLSGHRLNIEGIPYIKLSEKIRKKELNADKKVKYKCISKCEGEKGRIKQSYELDLEIHKLVIKRLFEILKEIG